MTKISKISLMSLSLLLAAQASLAANVRVTNPNAFSGEALGRAGTFSFAYDRAMDEDLAAGIGFGWVSTQTQVGSVSANSVSSIPVYVNYYFTREQGSLFGTAGATILTSTTTGLESSTGSINLNSSVLATFGLGYENRGDSGFLFRIAAYGLLGKELNPWGGFTLGYAF
jgi:hypothetical protein